MLMRKWFLFVLIFLAFLPTVAKAESQDACAIWLCLPGGFPSGCSGAYSEFKHRIKKGKPPLPPFASCSVDGKGNGKYELGVERYEPCKTGFGLIEREGRTYCVETGCIVNNRLQGRLSRCNSYAAINREKPHFAKMWVDGKYLGQFFY
jgi:hypothetical protein